MSDEFIDINLDDIDDYSDPIPQGPQVCEVKSAEMKHKEGSTYPYVDVRLTPTADEWRKRKLRLTLSFHPDALWNLKRFYSTCGISLKGLKLADFVRDEIYKRAIGSHLAVNLNVVPDNNDPTIMRNEVTPPYQRA